MLTPEPPKFLRFQLTTDGKVLATSWKAEHRGREFGLVLEPEPEVGRWSAARIIEGHGDTGFSFQSSTRSVELVHVAAEGRQFGGWAVCEWTHGHPQLFWITEKLGDASLPDFMERVVLEPVPIFNQPGTEQRSV